MKRTSYPAWKSEALRELKDKLLSSKVVGVLDFEGFPSDLFQSIRERLRGEAEILVARNTLIRLALSEASKQRKGLDELSRYVQGQSALIFTNLPPMKLNRLLKGWGRKAPAKPGRISSTEVVLKAGETDFPPGPMVSEMQRAGIKARVQAGKVVISEDFTVIRKGEVITKEKAELLSKLGVEPVDLLLKLRAAWVEGLTFSGDLLELDEERLSEDLRRAHREALSLALSLQYPTSLTIPQLLLRARSESLCLAKALTPGFPTKETLPELLARAHLQALQLSSKLEGKAS